MFCDLCPQSFSLKRSLIEHVKRVHLKLQSYDCNECDFSIFSKQHRDKDAFLHNLEDECEVCLQFGSKVFDHLETHNESGQRPENSIKFPSEKHEADKKVQQDQSSVKALVLKGNEGLGWDDSHTCCFCKKVLACRGTLKGHLEAVHYKSSKLNSDLCPKIPLKNANIHHRTTSHKKVYKCESCNESFQSRNQLSR